MATTPITPPRSPDGFFTPEPGSPKETNSPHPQTSPQSANSPMFLSPRVTLNDISFTQPDDDNYDDHGKTPSTSRPGSKTLKTLIRQKSIQIENLFAYEKDSNLHRDEWLHSYDFNLSSLLYATGLGSIREFPMRLIEGGGAAFLIPYFVMCFLMMCPMLMLEMAMGQFTSRGPTHCWGFARMFTGVGYGMVMICFVTTLSYATTVGKVFEYLMMTVTLEMRWSSDHMMHQGNSGAGNSTNVSTTPISVFHGAEKLYLAHSGEFGEYGIGWHLVLGVIASNLLAAASLAFGKKVAARVNYIGAFLAYGLLTAGLILSLRLPGATEGVSHFMKPNTTKLLDSNVWACAAEQCYYSLGLAMGVYHAMASYNNFHQNTLNNALYVIVGDTMFSIMASCLVFSLVGYISHERGIVDLDDILRGNKYDMLYVVVPAALSYRPNAQLLCFVYFLGMLATGWTSLVSYINTLMTAAVDIFKLGMDRQKLVAAVTFLVISATAVPICSKRGYDTFQKIDDYIYTLTLAPMGLLEVLAVSRVYGTVTFISDIELMVGWGVSCLLDHRTAKLIWGNIWGVLNPVLSCGIIVLEVLALGDIYKAEEPVWANVVGILGVVSVYVLILGNIVVLMLFATKGPCKERARTLLTPSPEWGPAKSYLRHMWETLRKDPSSYEKPFTFTGYLLPLVMSYVPACCKKCFGFRCLNNKPPPPRWKELGHYRPPSSHNVAMTWSQLGLYEP